MKHYIFIGLFVDPPVRCVIYEEPDGKAPMFGSNSQADQFIKKHGLPLNASPILISDYELPDRNHG